jgi:antirestriction protein ArdC
MQHPPGASRADLYREVSDQIIAQIEAGAGTFQMPWHHDGSPLHRPMNAVSREPYRGINVFVLWAAARAADYPTGLWATYKQWGEFGAQVRKGERGTLAVFWKRTDEAEAPGMEEPDEDRKPRFVARRFWLFNVAQVDGYVAPEIEPLPEERRIAGAEKFIRNLGIRTEFGGDQAMYVPSGDYVVMPRFERFRDAAAFYAVHLHECSHASGAPHRLNRVLDTRFGSDAYAMEEMIADWAACLASMSLEICSEPRPDHARYISSWLEILRGDKRAVFTAASKAQEIADWMWRQQSL